MNKRNQCDIYSLYVTANTNANERKAMDIWLKSVKNKLLTRPISSAPNYRTMFSSILWRIQTVRASPNDPLFKERLVVLAVIRTRETAAIIYKQLKSLNKIDIGYFSIDTDFREHNLLLSFLLEGENQSSREWKERVEQRSISFSRKLACLKARLFPSNETLDANGSDDVRNHCCSSKYHRPLYWTVDDDSTG